MPWFLDKPKNYFTFLLLLVCFHCCAIADDKQITIVADQWHPMHFINESGNPEGALYEVVHRAFSGSSITFDYYNEPFARAMKSAKEHENVLMLSVGRYPAREAQYKWLALLFEDNTYAVALKNRTDLNVNTIDELKPLTLGLVRGYPTDLLRARLGNGIKKVEVTRAADLWEALYSGRVDYIVTSQRLAHIEAKSYGYNPEKIKGLVRLTPVPFKIYAVTSHNTPPDVASKIADALNSFIETAEYDAIMEKWGVTPLSVSLRTKRALVAPSDDTRQTHDEANTSEFLF